ncbi:MAG: superoxide dismutase [Anaerolineae bacterium]|jgi:Fe-Mn family superoxide dismutase
MTFELPALPYAYDALEPHIDARTMEIHHTKHHQGYVNNLNAALEGQERLAAKGIEDLLSDLDSVPERIRTAVRNNGGGHLNHSMFWTTMSPDGGFPGSLEGKLNELENGALLYAKIVSDLGSAEEMRAKFTIAAMSRFGSGWAWLSLDGDKLVIESTANQDSPLMEGRTPLMGIDVWEHAYYLHYQNRRNDYISAWWNVVDWKAVADRFAAATA